VVGGCWRVICSGVTDRISRETVLARSSQREALTTTGDVSTLSMPEESDAVDATMVSERSRGANILRSYQQHHSCYSNNGTGYGLPADSLMLAYGRYSHHEKGDE
jgi:hypothetical protein